MHTQPRATGKLFCSVRSRGHGGGGAREGTKGKPSDSTTRMRSYYVLTTLKMQRGKGRLPERQQMGSFAQHHA